MTTMRWFRAGNPGRGAPNGRITARYKRLALLLLVLAGFIQGGCASLGLGNGCGTCGLGRGGGLRLPRIFNRSSCDSCGSVGAGIPAVEYGAPPPALVPAPGAVVPAPSAPIDQLEPAPGPAEPDSSSRGNGSSTGKANYEAYRPAYRPRTSRGPNLARALAPSEPARRPAPRVSPPPSDNPLDNLPPLTLPKEAAGGEASPGVSPDAGALPPPAAELQRSQAPAPASQPPAPTAPAEASPEPAAGEVSVVPGIGRFQGLEPKLAGGSLPSLTGLDWLSDKGYKTILDLREIGEGQSAYMAEVTRRGLRYLPLPISVASINAEQVNRFNAELDQADARPLYFFDTEGDRAGAMWYIRRLTVDHVKVDAKTAAQEARDLGLSDQKFWLAASAYLNSLAPVKAKTDPATGPDPEPAPESPQPKSTEVVDPSRLLAADDPAEPEPEPGPAAPQDPTAWKPLAALIVTSLGVPLAYWSRSIFNLGASAKASLPAPARRPRSLPDASDAGT